MKDDIFGDILGDIFGDMFAEARKARRIAREAELNRPFEDSELPAAIALTRRIAGIPSDQPVDEKRALGELQVMLKKERPPFVTAAEDILLSRFIRHRHHNQS